VLEAVAADRWVFVVEGEKDVEALETVGLRATCNAGGAGKWRPEWAPLFAGAKVAVLPDNDDPGATHTRAVAASLAPVAAVVKVVDLEGLDDHGDVTDWLAGGGTRDELVDLVRSAPPWERVEPVDNIRAQSTVREPGTLHDGHRPTDAGNAARFIEACGDRIRYVHAWGKWLCWDGTRWKLDHHAALVTELAKEVPRRLMASLADLTGEDRDKAFAWAKRSEGASALRNTVDLARGAPGILVSHDALDADPYLLNCANGTVDLRSGILRPHEPADLITLTTGVDYDEGAHSDLWEACLARWQPDGAMRDYLQLEAGAGATGVATEMLPIHIGGGGNGKSRYFGALQRALGDYACVPDKSLLVTGRHEEHRTVVASLFRRRLAVASETRQTDHLDEERVKSLTGGDRLQARRMREDPWEFEPSHTLVLFTNHRPTISGRDEGIWRRVRLVPWDITIPPDERDPHLAERLAEVAPAVLAWMVRGAGQYLGGGTPTVPDAVQVATTDYRLSSDMLGAFVAEVLVLGLNRWATAKELRDELERWCGEQGLMVPDPRLLATTLSEAGCRMERRTLAGKRSRVWVGVTIGTPADDLGVDPEESW
jgi:putative DNA primase/helicase